MKIEVGNPNISFFLTPCVFKTIRIHTDNDIWHVRRAWWTAWGRRELNLNVEFYMKPHPINSVVQAFFVIVSSKRIKGELTHQFKGVADAPTLMW